MHDSVWTNYIYQYNKLHIFKKYYKYTVHQLHTRFKASPLFLVWINRINNLYILVGHYSFVLCSVILQNKYKTWTANLILNLEVAWWTNGTIIQYFTLTALVSSRLLYRVDLVWIQVSLRLCLYNIIIKICFIF